MSINRFKQLRKERGMTQAELASLLFVKQQSVTNYEKGVNTPDISVLKKMAQIFEVSIDYLVGLTDIRTPAYKMQPLPLNDLETKLVNSYREVTPDIQNDIGNLLLHIKNNSEQNDK